MNTDFRVSIMFTRHPNTRLLRKKYGTDAAWALVDCHCSAKLPLLTSCVNLQPRKQTGSPSTGFSTKILEGKYDSERPVIADIHSGHGRYIRSRTTSQNSPQSEMPTETSGEVTGTPKEKIPEENRRRLCEYHIAMYGTNEGNPL